MFEGISGPIGDWHFDVGKELSRRKIAGPMRLVYQGVDGDDTGADVAMSIKPRSRVMTFGGASIETLGAVMGMVDMVPLVWVSISERSLVVSRRTRCG